MFLKIFDFKPMGNAIKTERENRKISREKLAETLDMDVRYLAHIENEGKNPGFALFYTLVTMFDISIDRYFYPEDSKAKSTTRRHIETLMDSFDETDLMIIYATANAISKSKELKCMDSSLTYTVSDQS